MQRGIRYMQVLAAWQRPGLGACSKWKGCSLLLHVQLLAHGSSEELGCGLALVLPLWCAPRAVQKVQRWRGQQLQEDWAAESPPVLPLPL